MTSDKTNTRADLFCGIGQAINELVRLRDHLMKFGLTEEQQLEGVEEGAAFVGKYLMSPENWYRFEDLCTPKDEKEKP